MASTTFVFLVFLGLLEVILGQNAKTDLSSNMDEHKMSPNHLMMLHMGIGLLMFFFMVILYKNCGSCCKSNNKPKNKYAQVRNDSDDDLL